MLVPPVIDVEPLLGSDGEAPGRRASHRGPEFETIGAELHQACTETGFFILTGHGLEDQLVDLFAGARAFFDQAQEVKERIPRLDRYGFVPHAASAIDASRASSRTEYLDLGLGDEVAMPEVDGQDLDATIRRYQGSALVVGHVILAELANSIGQPRRFFREAMSKPQCRLRFLHYPAVEPGPDGTLPVPTEPHTDYGLITILATDGTSGLEVKPIGGDWLPVPAEAGQLVVNLGDMMARWTNDRYRSTPHRVVGPASGDRISIPFFVNPNPEVMVTTIESCITEDRPRHYEPVTAGDFLATRIDGAVAGAAEPYVDRTEGPARRLPDPAPRTPSRDKVT